MKYLVIFALVIVVLWLWRAGRRPDSAANGRPPNPSGDNASPSTVRRLDPNQPVTEIVACDVCHIHLPRTEALTGPGGFYCSAAHRQQASP